jgi:hypothetical protein
MSDMHVFRADKMTGTGSGNVDDHDRMHRHLTGPHRRLLNRIDRMAERWLSGQRDEKFTGIGRGRLTDRLAIIQNIDLRRR